jgi:hypothetical protein
MTRSVGIELVAVDGGDPSVNLNVESARPTPPVITRTGRDAGRRSRRSPR